MPVLAVVAAHLVLALCLPGLARYHRRLAFGAGAVLLAGTLVWAVVQAPAALGPGVTDSLEWAPELGLRLSLRLDALALAMIVLVSGVGALIMVYAAWYFGPRSRDAARSAALLVTFAGMMLGLVLADDLLTLYVFWELTSLTSFLLVGQGGQYRENRRAAVQALLVTVFGGLSMLLGIVLLGQLAGTYSIPEITAASTAGTLAPDEPVLLAVSLVLILMGALTKSAQLPFHPWLPYAMAAPTPISAYLHAASMVKAGVVLVARLGPAFAVHAVWWVPVVGLGLATMLLGGWRALRQTDLKRLLAFGTVSQLGFLMVLFGAGSRVAALAGIAMLLAHGLFKAPLFMVVGAIDKACGTRDLRELCGLGRRRRGLAVLGTLAGLSMAGLPPMLGFVGKEAAYEAFLLEGGVRGWIVALGLLTGSLLTVAYTARFLWGAFATKGTRPTGGDPVPLGLSLPAWLCALTGLAAGFAAPLVQEIAAAYARPLPPLGDPYAAQYGLALWHGIGLALGFTLVAVVGGLLLHRYGSALTGQAKIPGISAQRGYEAVVTGLERFAIALTGRLQIGSLPVYLACILITLIVLPGPVLALTGALPESQEPYHSIMQVPVGLMVIVAALALTRARRRFTAVLLVGAVGYGIGGLFVIDGAPDLALAQFLVETLTLVAFVFVLRRLPAHFDEPETERRVRLPKAAVAAVGGLLVAGTAVVLSGARVLPPATTDAFVAGAPQAGATNLISAILVDFRALDTIGEITILLICAAGTASLVLATRYDKKKGGTVVDSGSGSPKHEQEVLG
ncbi:hydrogen gas-evolving membrane-bound hydrogenase subunit E [Pseudonocardia sp. HH130630-07]|uniref:hydrogen gas-evolving membrane-bound hydrogenase subunit E n=1 Tax=Pseudonocardia sp. HH130630-07 TaxID=1690815 RepID=UPI0012EA8F73